MLSRSHNHKNKNVDGLTRKTRVRDDSFFADLDRAKNKFGGFWTITVIILLIIFIGVIYFAVDLKRTNIEIGNSSNNIDENIDLSFADRLSTIGSLGVTNLSFNSQEFTVASGANGSDFPLKDSQFNLSKNQIFLSGKVRDSWIPIPVKLKIDAVVTGNKFLFIVAPNDLGNIVVYGQNKNKIEQTFDQNINLVLKDNNMIAKSLSISDNQIEFQLIKEPK